MKEITGNYWDYIRHHDVLLVTTNCTLKSDGSLVMDKGIAKQFADRFSGAPGAFGALHSSVPNKPVSLMFQLSSELERLNHDGHRSRFNAAAHSYQIISMPVKYNWQLPADPVLLFRSAKYIAERTLYRSFLSVRPGCGAGGLAWEDVKPALEAAGWDDRFTIISPEE